MIIPITIQNLDFRLKNCNVVAKPTQGPSSITIYTWLLGMDTAWYGLPKRDHLIRVDNDTLSVDVRRPFASSYFQCTVYVTLHPDTEFDTISYFFEPALGHVRALSTAVHRARKKISIDAFHGLLGYYGLESPLVEVNIGEGYFKGDLDGPDSSYQDVSKKTGNIQITSISAPVYLCTCHPIKTHLTPSAASRSMIRADADIHVDSQLGPDGSQIVTYSTPNNPCGDHIIDLHIISDEAPTYIVTREFHSDEYNNLYHTWAGYEQLEPSLTKSSLARLNEVRDWIKMDESTNWTADISVVGEGLPIGNWRFISSSAFIDYNPYFFITSGGLLSPRKLIVHLHILGLFCTESGSGGDDLLIGEEDSFLNELSHALNHPIDPLLQKAHVKMKRDKIILDNNVDHTQIGSFINRTYVGNKCEQEIMEKEFRSFWRALTDIHAPSIYPLWRHSDGRQMYFDIHRDAVVVEPVTWWQFQKAFHATVLVNFIVTILGAFVCVKWARYGVQDLLIDRILNESNLEMNGSYRLDHDLAYEPATFYLSVTRYDTVQGWYIRLRWTPSESKPLFLGVLIEPVIRETSHVVDDKKDTIDILASKEQSLNPGGTYFAVPYNQFVKTVNVVSGTQHELLVPYRHPSVGMNSALPDFLTQQWKLDTSRRYRFKIVTLNGSHQILEESSWSHEICLGSMFRILRISSLVVRSFLQNEVDSLSVFMLKYCLLCPPTNWTLDLSHLQLHVFGAYLDNANDLDLHHSPKSSTTTMYEVFIFVGTDGLKARKMTDVSRKPTWAHGQLHIDHEADPLELNAIVFSQSNSQRPIRLDFWSADDMSSVVSVEVSSGGGRTVARGSVLVDGIQLAATQHLASYYDDTDQKLRDDADMYLNVKVALNSSTTGEAWGKLQARVNCQPLRKFIHHSFPTETQEMRQPCFIRDIAGSISRHGCEQSVRWFWPRAVSRPDNIYIHLIDSDTAAYLCPLHEGKAIQNTGVLTWPVEVPMHRKAIARHVRLVITEKAYDKLSPMIVLAQSHSFYIMRTVTLSAFEFAYATFCRSAEIPMVQVSKQALGVRGVSVSKQYVRVCQGLRRKFPFETCHHLVNCPGQYLISTQAKVTMSTHRGFTHKNKLLNSFASTSAGTSAQAVNSLSLDDELVVGSVNVIKSHNEEVEVVNDIYLHPDPYYWTESKDFHTCSTRSLVWLPGLKSNYALAKVWLDMSTDVSKTGFGDDSAAVFLLPSKHRHFARRRFILFEALPLALQSVWLVLKVFTAYLPDLTMLPMLFYANYLVTSFNETERSGLVDSQFLSDIVFSSDPWSFVKSVPTIWKFFFVFLNTMTAISVLGDLFVDRAPSLTSPWLSYCLSAVTYYDRSLRLFVIACFIISFILWFLATALCWSSIYFSALVAIGAIGFVIYSVGTDYDDAQHRISNYVNDNLQRLLGLALDGWFDATHTEFTDLTGEAITNELAVDRNEKYRDAIRQWRKRARKFTAFDRVAFFNSGHTLESSRFPKDVNENLTNEPWAGFSKFLPYARSRQTAFFQSTVANWTLAVWSTPRNKPFEISRDGQIYRGDLEHLPIAAKLATREELEREYKKEVVNLIQNNAGEPLVYTRGCVEGVDVEGELIFDESLEPGSRYTKAFILTPSFYHPRDVSYLTKLGMIFNYFDDGQKGLWRETEYRAWLAALQKPGMKRSWVGLQQKAWADCKMKIHPVLGLSIDELDKYYKKSRLIDQDYSALFPIVQEDDDRFSDGSKYSADENLMPLHSDKSEEEEESDLDSQSDREFYESSSSSDNDDDDDPFLFNPDDDEQEEIEQKLKSSLNARKLHIIYTHATQTHRDHRVDDLITPISSFALKILETQFRILSPIFGSSILFGTNQTIKKAPSPKNPTEDPRTAFPSKVTNLDLDDKANTTRVRFMIEEEKSSEEESEQKEKEEDIQINNEMEHVCKEWSSRLTVCFVLRNQTMMSEFAEIVRNLFDTENVNKVVTQFFEETLITKTQTATSWVLEERAPFSDQNLHPHTKRALESSAATTFQYIDKLMMLKTEGVIRAAKLVEISQLPANISIPLSAYLVLELLCTLGVLDQREVGQKRPVRLIGFDDHIVRFEAIIPELDELTHLLTSVVNTVSDGDLQPRHIFVSARRVLCEYLTLPAFLLVLRLLGFRVETDLFPAAVNYPHGSIFEKNKAAIEETFKSLSHFPYLLHRDLSDEAVVILTENKLNFVGMIQCLKLMNLDSQYFHHRSNKVIDAIKELGINETKSVINIERSHLNLSENFDWTWTWQTESHKSMLVPLFERKAKSKSGFISKNEVISLIAELEIEEFNPPLDSLYPPPRNLHRFPLPPRCPVCTMDMLHLCLKKMEMTVGREFTYLIWLLLCSQITDGIICDRLPIQSVCHSFINIISQPRDVHGRPSDWTLGYLIDITYSGWMDFGSFLFLLKHLDISITRKYAARMWHTFVKEPLDVTDWLPPGSPLMWVRTAQGRTGLDPNQGFFVQLNTIYTQLPRLLFTGLWPEGIRALVAFSLMMQPSNTQLAFAIKMSAGKRNRFGLLRYPDAAKVLSALSTEGMSYSMLEESVSKMRLKVPTTMVRQMFSFMDVNHDRTLDLSELLTGFELLFSKFIPPLIIQAVGVSSDHKTRAIIQAVLLLTILIAFIALTYSTFTSGGTDASSNAMQSLLAVVGAYTLQSSARQNEKEVASEMRTRIELILGEGLTKRLQEQQAIEETIKMHQNRKAVVDETHIHTHGYIAYKIPHELLADINITPMPSVRVKCGHEIYLVPTLYGISDLTDISWICHPPIPRRSGLFFCQTSGTIKGKYTGDSYLKAFTDNSIPQSRRQRKVLTISCQKGTKLIAKTRLSYTLIDDT